LSAAVVAMQRLQNAKVFLSKFLLFECLSFKKTLKVIPQSSWNFLLHLLQILLDELLPLFIRPKSLSSQKAEEQQFKSLLMTFFFDP
jgi:hypothetical protein